LTTLATTAAALAARAYRFLVAATAGRLDLDDLVVAGFEMLRGDVEGTELDLVRGSSCGG
jgi:hypothetical protein